MILHEPLCIIDLKDMLSFLCKGKFMNEVTKKKIIQSVMITVSAGLNIWGILSLLQTIGTKVGLGYIDKIPNIIGRYALVIITMAAGIMLMSYAAGTFNGKVKTVFSIAVCAYSTVMTIPLLLSFILMIPVAAGASLPAFLNDMVGAICDAFKSLAGQSGQYVIYVLGILMSVIFLAVPIFSTYCTVNDIDLIAIIKARLAEKKASADASSSIANDSDNDEYNKD